MYRTWLEQDVAWIITPEEKTAFKTLQNDEQRDEFIEAFWQRRDPTPDTYENEFKEEHYTRIAYANQHFGAHDLGWKTDRGRIYIVYGPPDRVTDYSAQDSHPVMQDSQNYAGLPIETWSYRYLEGVGMDVAIDFVDVCSCGDYRMRMPNELRDALLFIPEVGVDEKKLKSVRPDLYLKVVASPVVKFRALEALLSSGSKVRAVPIEVNTKITKATDVSSILQIAIAFQGTELASLQAPASRPLEAHVLGRITTLTGHVAELFEETIDLSSTSVSEIPKSIGLLEGHYRLEIAAEVADTDKTTVWTRVLNLTR